MYTLTIKHFVLIFHSNLSGIGSLTYSPEASRVLNPVRNSLALK